MTDNGKQNRSKNDIRLVTCICVILIILTSFVYYPVLSSDFINYDDPDYVTANHHVQKGIHIETIKWAFTSTVSANWHPITVLSHMLDYQIFGLNSGYHHLTNLILHILNTVLLFLILYFMTQSPWKCAFVAALFSLHPLHVESVAWISERKDVLSTFFWMLSIGFYIRYVKKPRLIRYMVLLLFLSIGLMSKPMIVTLPFILLLFDFWPLQRITGQKEALKYPDRFTPIRNTALKLVIEKIPLFLPVVITSMVTLSVQKTGGAFEALKHYPLIVKLANALSSYIIYLYQMMWPFKLSVFYPHTGMPSSFLIIISLCLLTGITLAALKTMKTNQWFFVGWFFYLGSLVPVIGIIQVGEQCRADRYTYIPLIGIFIILSWGFPAVVRNIRNNLFIPTVALSIIFALSVITAIQVRYWNNSIELFRHALAVTQNNHVAHLNVGTAIEDANKNIQDAIRHYRAAIAIKPLRADAHNNLAHSLYKIGNTGDAIKHYKIALKLHPSFALAHAGYGAILAERGQSELAVYHYNKALNANPDSVIALNNLGIELAKQGKVKKAIAHFEKALLNEPNTANTHFNLARALLMGNRKEDAVLHFEKAIQLNPKLRSSAGKILQKTELNKMKAK